MARRRSRRGYGQRNQLDSSTELIVGGIVAVAVVGTIGYLIYKNSTASAATASTANSGGLTAAQLGVPTGTPASDLSGDTNYVLGNTGS
jgi:hypothetical protein